MALTVIAIMKTFLHRLFAFNFNLMRIFSLKENRVSFLAPHPTHPGDTLSLVKERLDREGEYETRLIPSVTKRDGLRALLRFFTADCFYLATAKYIFLNDNFMPMAYMSFPEKVKIIQLWHGDGAFKRFALGSKLPKEAEKNMRLIAPKISFVICSGEGCVPIYAEAFGVPKERVLPLGSPRADNILFGEKADRSLLYDAYPALRGKRLVLYAPTFRDTMREDERLMQNIDMNYFSKALGSEYAFAVKLHPQVHSSSVPKGAIDLTHCKIPGLIKMCDVLVTDYSSICMDAALLYKKCIFFAFDKEKYSLDRSFYFDYDSYVPGPVVSTFEGVVEEIKKAFTFECGSSGPACGTLEGITEEEKEDFGCKRSSLDPAYGTFEGVDGEKEKAETEKTEEFLRFNFSAIGGAVGRICNLLYNGQEDYRQKRRNSDE